MSNNITRNLKRDGNRNPIQGGREVAGILNVTIDDISWTAIIMPSGSSCKQLMMSERGASNWKMSNEITGVNYLTVTGPLSVEAAFAPDAVICYAQMAVGSGVVEVLLTD